MIKVNDPSNAAETVLRDLDRWRLPIDPFEIAGDEGIELLPGDFSADFDGRIRYIGDISSFALAYRQPGPGRPQSRVRFTIGHELGHFYLHRAYLLSGKCHSSKANFTSHSEMEQEADEFAASLLMPMELFRKRIELLRSGVATLKELCKLANDEFCTSITSTVRRYCQSDVEPCAVVFSRDGVVQWGQFSEDMRRAGMGFVQFGGKVPRQSHTQRLLEEKGAHVDGVLDPWVWFDSARFSGKLWEEAMTLGYTGTVLTYLTKQ